MSRICKISGCSKPTVQRSRMCAMHRSRQTRNGDPTIRTRKIRITHLPCAVLGCNKPIAGKGLCATHWMRHKRRGDPCAPDLRPPRWTEKELRHLYAILDRTPDGLGHALPGELVHLSYILPERSLSALRTKLHELRAARKAAQNRAVLMQG